MVVPSMGHLNVSSDFSGGDTQRRSYSGFKAVADLLNRLNAEVRHLVQLPGTHDYFDKLALLSMDMDAAAVAKFVAEEYAFWAPLVRDIGLKVQ